MSSNNDIIRNSRETVSETSRLLENFNEIVQVQETWLGKPRLLWMFPFSLTLSIIMTSTVAPTIQLILELVCQEFKEQNKNKKLNLLDECNLPEIHVIASIYVMWYTSLLSIAG